eukprot:6227436-Pyramimonas_sp.AAC.1
MSYGAPWRDSRLSLWRCESCGCGKNHWNMPKCKHCGRHWKQGHAKPVGEAKNADNNGGKAKSKGKAKGQLGMAEGAPPVALPYVAGLAEAEVQQLILLARKAGNAQLAKQC